MEQLRRGRLLISLDDAMKVVEKTGASLDWIYRGVEHALPLHLAEKLQLTRTTEGLERDNRSPPTLA